jgi:hypothetical protein
VATENTQAIKNNIGQYLETLISIPTFSSKKVVISGWSFFKMLCDYLHQMSGIMQRKLTICI